MLIVQVCCKKPISNAKEDICFSFGITNDEFMTYGKEKTGLQRCFLLVGGFEDEGNSSLIKNSCLLTVLIL